VSAGSLNVRALLIDLDGTLYQGGRLIRGAAEALVALEGRGIPHRFVTNTTSRSVRGIVTDLSQMGLDVAREYLLARELRRCHLLVRPSLLEDFPGITPVTEAPDAVVVGDLGDEFTYERLTLAFRLLLDGAEFVALARNRYFLAADGLALDVGAFVAALEYACGRTATLVGKPSPEFFRPVLESLGVDPAHVAIVGDDLAGDVVGGQAAGMRGILVRTGKFRPDELARSRVDPDRVIDSLADLPAVIG
jgi:HAD superfamily hydrolase (TIGR01458 family)